MLSTEENKTSIFDFSPTVKKLKIKAHSTARTVFSLKEVFLVLCAYFGGPYVVSEKVSLYHFLMTTFSSGKTTTHLAPLNTVHTWLFHYFGTNGIQKPTVCQLNNNQKLKKLYITKRVHHKSLLFSALGGSSLHACFTNKHTHWQNSVHKIKKLLKDEPPLIPRK